MSNYNIQLAYLNNFATLNQNELCIKRKTKKRITKQALQPCAFISVHNTNSWDYLWSSARTKNWHPKTYKSHIICANVFLAYVWWGRMSENRKRISVKACFPSCCLHPVVCEVLYRVENTVAPRPKVVTHFNRLIKECQSIHDMIQHIRQRRNSLNPWSGTINY